MESSKGATISAINSITGVTTRYSFDPTADFQMPEGPNEFILVDGVYYAFEGWYSTPEMAEEDRVTVIYANTFNEDNNKYYSKWVPIAESKIVVHNKETEEVIGTILVDAGSEYSMPNPTEYIQGIVGDGYISGDYFYEKADGAFKEVTSVTALFVERHVYAYVRDVSKLVANILKNFNYDKKTFLVVSNQSDVARAGANIAKLTVTEATLANVYQLVSNVAVIVTVDAIKQIEEAYSL
jgi:hypothetical protein